jgi:hypothetical protein
MPLYSLKKVWKYCSYNKPFFIFILLLIFVLDWIQSNAHIFVSLEVEFIVQIVVGIVLSGYGMSITYDRINHGYRLPKILPGDVANYGFKSFLAYLVYGGFQFFVLGIIAIMLKFPMFNLEEMILDFQGTLNLLFVHNPVHTIIFFTVSAVLFYVTSFFAEIGLAKLADTKSLHSAFDLRGIYRSIGIFGWRNYARDITSIIIAMVILSYLKSITIPNLWINGFWDLLLGFLIFATQYLGIGAVYCTIKDMEREQDESQSGS